MSDDLRRHGRVEPRRAGAVLDVPQRRCVGCGVRAPKSELLRVVAAAGVVRPDPAQRMPGRGAYVCDRACAERALQRGAFDRALRSSVLIDPDLLHSL